MGEEDKKVGKKLDKLVMGIILGGAIGSVLGLTLAPRKGKETREIIKEKSQKYIDKGKEIAGTAAKDFIRDHKETYESAKYQLKKGKGFLRWLFGKKSPDRKMPHSVIDSSEDDTEG